MSYFVLVVCLGNGIFLLSLVNLVWHRKLFLSASQSLCAREKTILKFCLRIYFFCFALEMLSTVMMSHAIFVISNFILFQLNSFFFFYFASKTYHLFKSDRVKNRIFIDRWFKNKYGHCYKSRRSINLKDSRCCLLEIKCPVKYESEYMCPNFFACYAEKKMSNSLRIKS